MIISVDPVSLEEFLNSFLFNFGWIPIAIVFLVGVKEVWMIYIRNQWGKKNGDALLLAIDIPRNNAQSLKSVESLFVYITGAHGGINLIEKYWEGKFQLSFSFEIVSIEGYTQFLIRTPVIFRDLVESAVYAQYPDAEITEVDDYTSGFPRRYPDEKYDLWGSEMAQAANKFYPIKTYEEFEHNIGEPETYFRDPIAPLMDLNSSLGPGEQLWYQIIIVPIDTKWTAESDKEVSKVLGENTSSGPNIAGKFVDFIIDTIGYIGRSILGGEHVSSEVAKKDPLKMVDLKPGQKRKVEGIERKSSKLAFDTKIRMVYIAEKETINKPKAVNGFMGYLKQFGDNAMNGFKPDADATATVAAYFFVDKRINRRKGKIINNYINRSVSYGRNPGLLNVEELATLWHFPIEAVAKAPLIQKAASKKSKPPMDLPISIVEDKKVKTPSFLEEDVAIKNNSDNIDFSEDLNSDSLEDIIQKENIENEIVDNFDNKDDNKKNKNDDIVDNDRRDEPPSNLPL